MVARRKKAKYRLKRWVKAVIFTLLAAILIVCILKLIPKQFFNRIDASAASELSREDTKKLKKINSGGYPDDLVKFLDNHIEAIDFVYKYPENKDKDFSIDLSKEVSSDKVPLLIQWDKRWGYEKYGKDFIATGGCGPTALSMAAIYLTKNPDYTPLKIAETAYENGYYIEGTGSSWELMSDGCSLFGLNSRMVPLGRKYMEDELSIGNVIIASMGEGDFTKRGHFIVIKDFDNEGFYVNDPVSYVNSEKVWSYDRLEGQIKNMWAMSVA